MANKLETLKKKPEIASLFKNGKRIHSKFLTIVYKKNELFQSRFLFTTDKSCKTSVQRNRIKRICRAHIQNLSNIPAGFDIAIVGKWNFNQVPFQERNSLLLRHFQSIQR